MRSRTGRRFSGNRETAETEESEESKRNIDVSSAISEPYVKGMALEQSRAARIPAMQIDGGILTIALGQETFSPMAYNTFSVGPITLSVQLKDANIGAAYTKARSVLEEIFQVEFECKAQAFFARRAELQKLRKQDAENS